MNSAPPALPAAIVAVTVMGAAGAVHLLWLRSRWSLPLAKPIDGGRAWRGRRIFGDNKMWRGLVAMPLAAALLFGLAVPMRDLLPAYLAAGIWHESPLRLALVGFLCGLAFMLAELPNSFWKRRIGIAPGHTASGPGLKWLCLLIDRIDSTAGALITLQLLLPVHPMTYVYLLGFGAAAHAAYSGLMQRLRMKGRAALHSERAPRGARSTPC